MTILTASAARDGAVLVLGGLLPVTSTVKAMTIASDTSQPKMKAAPFLTPPIRPSFNFKNADGTWNTDAQRMCDFNQEVFAVCRVNGDDTIADLQKVPDLLRRRGYGETDVEAIMHGNWLRLFRSAL